MSLDELSIIDFLRPIAGEGAFSFKDDAALLTVSPDEDLVVTTDMIAAGVHFLHDDPPASIAQKALRVNVSDLAAKGATPVAYLLSAGFQPGLSREWLKGFTEGLRSDHELFGVRMLGGDTVGIANGPVLSITAIGRVPKGRMVHRFNAKPGDALYVSGTIGDATAGLAVLRSEGAPWDRLSHNQRDRLVRRYRVPEPRIGLIPALRAHARAAMDLSDGLVGDCDKLAAASGVSATIEAERVPLSTEMGSPDLDLLARLISGGDDYEILAAIPPAEEDGYVRASAAAGVPVTRIGTVEEGSGMVDVRFHGRPMQFKSRAYVHGSGGS